MEQTKKINRFRRLGLPLLLLVALLASLAWTWLAIQPLPAQVPVQEQFLNFTPDYTITATQSLSIWPAGTTLEQGRVGYFYTARPVVDLKPLVSVSGLDQGQLNGTIQTRVFLQAVNEKNQIYWSFPLQTVPDQSFTLSKNMAGVTDQADFTLNSLQLDVAAAYDRMTAISKELAMNGGNAELVVQYDVTLTGTGNGLPINKTLQNTMPLTLQSISFSLPQTRDNLSNVLIGTSAGTVPDLRTQYLALARANWLPLSVNLALLVALLVVLGASKARSGRDVVDHHRFREWITEGTIQLKDNVPINILSLEGLVDLAIDLDKRVIHDPLRKQYFVLDERVAYVFDPFKPVKDATASRPQLGKLLLDRGLLRPEQLETGLYYQQRTGSRLGETLTALGFIDETTLYSILAAQQQFNYVELDPAALDPDRNWLARMSISQARVLMALPLGQRADGPMVVACSEPGREGVRKALQEFFGADVVIVAARPSAIADVLASLEDEEKTVTRTTAAQVSADQADTGPRTDAPGTAEQQPGQTATPAGLSTAEYRRAHAENGIDRDVSRQSVPGARPASSLTDPEWDPFYSAYYRGIFVMDRFLLAAGLAGPHDLPAGQSRELLLADLVRKNIIDSETANLLQGLGLATSGLDWQARLQNQLPDLQAVLQQANFLTQATTEWVNREMAVQKLPVDRLLVENHLASAQTVSKARHLLHSLQAILSARQPPETPQPGRAQ